MLLPVQALRKASEDSNNPVAFAISCIIGASVVVYAGKTVYDALTLSKEEKAFWKMPSPKFSLPFIHDLIPTMLNVGSLHDWVYEHCEKFQGRPWRWVIPGRPCVIVCSTTKVVEDILKNQFENFHKGPYFNTNLNDLIGEGIFAVDGPKWVHQRKTASHLFTMRALREKMTSVIRSEALILSEILFKASKNEKEVDLFKLFNRFTIETFSEIGFGIRLGCLEAKEDHPFQNAFDSAQHSIFLRFIRPIWFWKIQRFFCFGAEKNLQKNIKIIDQTVYDIISKSLEAFHLKKHTNNKDDVVSLFLDHQMNLDTTFSNSKKEFDPTYLRDIVVSFLIAGRDTTAQALSWFFYCLNGPNKNIEKKIREEIKQTLPHLFDQKKKIIFPTMEETGQLVYLEACIRETLRLYPSVPMNAKLCVKDTFLCDGTFVQGGNYVVFPSYTLGRMKNIWGKNAHEFQPERWIDVKTNKIKPISSFQFLSFHAGPRICLGMNLAMLEMKILLAGLIAKIHIQIQDREKITYANSLTLPVKGPMRAKITRL
jgi:fatty acid omega-hydroxylase